MGLLRTNGWNNVLCNINSQGQEHADYDKVFGVNDICEAN